MNIADQTAILDLLDHIIRDAVPGVQTVSKYGGTLYTLHPDEKEGQFCGIFPYKDHVQLAFSQGATLDDPAGVLTGAGKHRRHVNYKTPGNIKADVVGDLIRKAAQHSQS